MKNTNNRLKSLQGYGAYYQSREAAQALAISDALAPDPNVQIINTASTENSTKVLEAVEFREYFEIQNYSSSQDVWVNFGAPASRLVGIRIAPNQTYKISNSKLISKEVYIWSENDADVALVVG